MKVLILSESLLQNGNLIRNSNAGFDGRKLVRTTILSRQRAKLKTVVNCYSVIFRLMQNSSLKDLGERKEISEDEDRRGQETTFHKITDKKPWLWLKERLAAKEKTWCKSNKKGELWLAFFIGLGKVYVWLMALILNSSGRKPAQPVAIIMDGNNRWAKKKHLPSIAGHYGRCYCLFAEWLWGPRPDLVLRLINANSPFLVRTWITT